MYQSHCVGTRLASRGPGALAAARRAFAACRVSSLAASRTFGFGLAANSPTRRIGRALLAANAPASGRPALRTQIKVRACGANLFPAGPRPAPRPSLNCPVSPLARSSAGLSIVYRGVDICGPSVQDGWVACHIAGVDTRNIGQRSVAYGNAEFRVEKLMKVDDLPALVWSDRQHGLTCGPLLAARGGAVGHRGPGLRPTYGHAVRRQRRSTAGVCLVRRAQAGGRARRISPGAA